MDKDLTKERALRNVRLFSEPSNTNQLFLLAKTAMEPILLRKKGSLDCLRLEALWSNAYSVFLKQGGSNLGWFQGGAVITMIYSSWK